MQKIKKAVRVVLFFCIIFCLKSNVSAAENAGVSVGTAEGMPGDTVAVSFRVSENPGTTMYEMKIAYDKDVLQVISVEKGDVYPEWYPSDLQKYPLYISAGDALSLDNITDDALLTTIYFKIADDAEAGEYRFQIQDGLFLDADLKAYEVSYDDGGCVTVKTEQAVRNETKTDAKNDTEGKNDIKEPVQYYTQSENDSEKEPESNTTKKEGIEKDRGENEEENRENMNQTGTETEKEKDNIKETTAAIKKEQPEHTNHVRKQNIILAGIAGVCIVAGLFLLRWKKQQKRGETNL